jgi:hypothetical protein
MDITNIVAKKEALLLLSMLRESTSVYVTKSVTGEAVDSLSIELPITLFDIAYVITDS